MILTHSTECPNEMTQALIITQPDDWHVHLRDDAMLAHTVPATAKHFARALVMPNLKTPLISLNAILEYRDRILKASYDYPSFQPYMTFYLNEQLSIDTLVAAHSFPFILGAKLYPAGVTTHSEQGAASITALYPVFEAMQAEQKTLQIHGECLNGDIFERERLFIETYLKPIVQNFPKLFIVLEHISTKAAVDFILETSSYVAATITPHHLLYNRNHLLSGGIKPHYYCLPILKHENDQKALLEAAVSANPKFFAGTDSAPHPQKAKESACGCAGIYSAPFAVALYAEAFERANHLHRLDAFLSQFGAEFYRLPRNQTQLTLIKQPQLIPQKLPLGETEVIPIASGETLAWSIRV